MFTLICSCLVKCIYIVRDALATLKIKKLGFGWSFNTGNKFYDPEKKLEYIDFFFFFAKKNNVWPLWTFICAVIYLYASDYILTTKKKTKTNNKSMLCRNITHSFSSVSRSFAFFLMHFLVCLLGRFYSVW